MMVHTVTGHPVNWIRANMDMVEFNNYLTLWWQYQPLRWGQRFTTVSALGTPSASQTIV